MGEFDAFRTPPAPTLYGSIRSAVTADVLEIGLIVAACMVFFSILLTVPGVIGWPKKLSMLGNSFFTLYISTSILVSIFGFGWRVDQIHTETGYKQFTHREISADVGIKIGLYGFNVTLKGTPRIQLNETIDYNEHFEFGMLQGRLGFGTQAGTVNREFRDAQYRGKPLPILWVSEYFTLDGERIRWGRAHRQAGYYTALLLWTAFSFWVLTVPIIFNTIAYGAGMMALTGTTLIVSVCVYAGLHYDIGPELKIPFASATLSPKYGWAFILTLLNGIICIFLSVVIMVVYWFYPDWIYQFFGIDLSEEEDVISTDEVEPVDEFAESPPTTVKTQLSRVATVDEETSTPRPHSPGAVSPGHVGGMSWVTTPTYLPHAKRNSHSIYGLRKSRRRKPRRGQMFPQSPIIPEGGDIQMNPLYRRHVSQDEQLSLTQLPGSPSISTHDEPLADESNTIVSVQGALGRKFFKQNTAGSHSVERPTKLTFGTSIQEEDEDVFNESQVHPGSSLTAGKNTMDTHLEEEDDIIADEV